jgi:hypothetical protein
MPADSQIWMEAWQGNSPLKNCGDWTRCKPLKKILAFNPFVYSADVLIPVIDLKQRAVWSPVIRPFAVDAGPLGVIDFPGWTARLTAWLENLLGTLAVLLYGALISGVIKRK